MPDRAPDEPGNRSLAGLKTGPGGWVKSATGRVSNWVLREGTLKDRSPLQEPRNQVHSGEENSPRAAIYKGGKRLQ